MKSLVEPIEDRLEKMVGFKEVVSKKCLFICKEINELKEMFKKFEVENQPLFKDLVVF